MARGTAFVGLLALVLSAVGCERSGGASRTPASEDNGAAETSDPGLQAGHELDVGMEFEGGDEAEDSEGRRIDRSPPPTQAYSPPDKVDDDEEKNTGP